MTANQISDMVHTLVFKPSCIHGMGVFARRDLMQGTLVIEYIGQKINKRESLRCCEENNYSHLHVG